MKRILFFMTILFILFTCSINCLAAEYEDLQTGNVYGKFNYYSNAGVYTAASANGKYVIIADNGIMITVSSDNLELTLVVHQITENEKECYDWINSCIKQEVIDFIPYDIFFRDTMGNRIELSAENTISIKTLNLMNHILELSSAGSVTNIPYLYENGVIKFVSTSSGNYYLLCKIIKEQNSPQTGNDSINIECFIIIVVSGAILTYLCLKQRKERQK